MPMIITHTWKCDLCGWEECGFNATQTIRRPSEIELRWSLVPRQWHMIDDKLVCYRHRIVVDKVNSDGDPSLIVRQKLA